MGSKYLLNVGIQPLAAAQSSPVQGQIYFNTTSSQFGVYTGSSWTYFGSGSGTVTSVSVATANGFAGTVATASSTPAITVSTTVTGLLKGNGTAISAATAGTDYVVPSTFIVRETPTGTPNGSTTVFTLANT